jgi:hypothetical protein
MKKWKVALASFAIGIGLSVAPIATYACAGIIWIQDQPDCHMYSRYVLVGSSSENGVEICAYEDAMDPCKHREDSCDQGPILE